MSNRVIKLSNPPTIAARGPRKYNDILSESWADETDYAYLI